MLLDLLVFGSRQSLDLVYLGLPIVFDDKLLQQVYIFDVMACDTSQLCINLIHLAIQIFLIWLQLFLRLLDHGLKFNPLFLKSLPHELIHLIHDWHFFE